MRVTMYLEDYTPYAVIDADPVALQWLMDHPGDTVAMASPPPMDYRAQNLPVTSRFEQGTGRVTVEGLRWGDSVVRPILMVRGASLCRVLRTQGVHTDDMARALFREATGRAPRTESRRAQFALAGTGPPQPNAVGDVRLRDYFVSTAVLNRFSLS